MTREEILAIPAGHELDIIVAKKVMGWQVKGFYLVPPELADRLLDHHQIPDVPAFSTDIAAAWRVVEKLKASGLEIELETVADPDGPHDAWHVVVYGHAIHGAAYAPTAQLALCWAALLALENSHAS